MNEKSLVSILVPAYNHAAYVERCLDSIVEDAYPRKELIIIDDGSTDSTRAVISSWLKQKGDALEVRFVTRENRGISRTLNELGKLAKGTFLRITASDDFLLPNGLTDQVGFLERFPSKLAVFGDAVVVDGDGAKTFDSLISGVYGADKSNYQDGRMLKREIICRWSVGGPVLMLRKSAFEALGGWNEKLAIEDWDLYLRLLSIDGLGFIDTPVGAYRLHQTNTSRTRNIERRIRNLENMKTTAHQCSSLFEEPFGMLLRAQEKLASSKIAFLRRRFMHSAFELMKYGRLSAQAHLKGV